STCLRPQSIDTPSANRTTFPVGCVAGGAPSTAARRVKNAIIAGILKPRAGQVNEWSPARPERIRSPAAPARSAAPDEAFAQSIAAPPEVRDGRRPMAHRAVGPRPRVEHGPLPGSPMRRPGPARPQPLAPAIAWPVHTNRARAALR